MKYFFFFCFFSIAAQDKSLLYNSDEKLELLLYNYQKLSKNKGYRIQISSLSSREPSKINQQSFEAKYPAYRTYMQYQQPYFKIRVGDFLSKLSALRELESLKKDYPNAFIVEDEIVIP